MKTLKNGPHTCMEVLYNGAYQPGHGVVYSLVVALSTVSSGPGFDPKWASYV